MDLPEIKNYEIKESRSGHKVPVLNDVHLHSIYNPTKEAETFIQKNEKLLKENKNILILGLGYGYHINTAITKMDEFHDGPYDIMVIEPSDNITNDCPELQISSKSNVFVISGQSIEQLYQLRDFVEFLAKAPAVISHPASFNFYRHYFKKLFTHRANNTIEEISSTITSNEVKSYLATMDSKKTLYKSIEEKGKLTEPLDFFFNAFANMTNKETKTTTGAATE